MIRLYYKLILTFALGLITVCQGYSQALKAEGIRILITDMSASIYSRNDNNGNSCGLVKVEFAKPGAAFEGNVIGSTEYKAGEYWVYLSPGSKFLKVKHAEYTPVILQFDGSTVGAVESKKVYAVKISDGPKDELVTFKITPANAVLTVDNKEYATSDGKSEIMLSPGEHNYMIVASGYNVQGGKFMVYENDINKIIVELDPKSIVPPAPEHLNEISDYNYIVESENIANKWIELKCRNGLNENEILETITTIAYNNFNTIEVCDLANGIIKTGWVITSLPAYNIRVRMETRRKDSIEDGNITFLLRFDSQIKYRGCQGSNCYENYDNLLPKYTDLITKLINSICVKS